MTFNKIQVSIFHKHFPLKTDRVTKTKASWLTQEIRKLVSERDKARLNNNPSTTKWKHYKGICEDTMNMV